MDAYETLFLAPVDIVVLVIYFLAVVATGFYAMCSSKRDTTDGYFLAGRFITFVPIGASLFASNIGADSFLGLAGSGAVGGISVAAYELSAMVILQILGFLFVPIYMASGVITLPEYLQKRFGGRRIPVLLSVLSLVLYVLTKMSVNFFSGALFIKVALGWDIAASLALIIGLSAFCTISGGLAAVIYTDTIQAFLMVGGAMTMMAFGFEKVGGINALYECYAQARPSNTTGVPDSCGDVRSDAFIIMQDAGNPTSDLPWAGFIFGFLSVSIWYWCADQVIVQRSLSAKNVSHAQGATIMAGYMKFLPLFMLVFPGLLARVLYPDLVACPSPAFCQSQCGDPSGCSNFAYPYLIMDLMPDGLRGLMVAVMLAALITGLTSIFNSASSLFTVDIYPLFRKNPTTREEMIVGRVFVVVMVVLSVLWIPLVQGQQGGQLFLYIQSVLAYLTPPISSIFLVAILWPRANEQGAFWSLLVGLVVGSIRLILEFVYPAPPCGGIDTRPAVIAEVHYMYFTIITFWGTVILMVVISLLTKPDKKWRTIRTSYWTRFDETVRPDELPDDVKTAEMNQQADSLEMEEKTTSANPNQAEIVSCSSSLASEHSSSSSDSDSSSDKDGKENTSCAERFELPSSIDPETGNRRPAGKMCKLWCLWVAGWFCGFSLNNKPTVDFPIDASEKAKNKRHEVEGHVRELVSSLHQDKRSYWMLIANLVIVIVLSSFMFVFFSIPPEITGLFTPNRTNCSKFV